jgi:hypothetical protein
MALRTGCTLSIGLALLAAVSSAAPLPKEAGPLRTAYDTSLASVESETRDQLGRLAAEYGKVLAALRDDLQQAGRLRPLVAVHDELVRHAKSPEPAAPGLESVELGVLQGAYLARVQQVRYSNDVEVVKLAERYLQALAELRTTLGRAQDEEALKGLDEERDRMLASARVRAALQVTRTPPPAAPAYDLASSATSTNQPADRGRAMKLFRPANEDVSKVMGYAVTMNLIEDTSRVKVRESVAGMVTTRSEDGPVSYTPRLTISCRNAEIPPDAEMTIDYFSRSMTDSGYRKESSETLALPRIPRGESASIEGRGISLTRSTAVTHTGRGPDARSYSGSEFFGLIVTIRDSRREVLLVRFAPQQLEKLLEGESP